MTAALILAASVPAEGSKRKPTDDVGGASSIKRLIMVFEQAGIKPIIVVTGYDAEAVEKHCSHMGVIFIRYKDYETGGLLGSVKTGLDFLKNKCAKVYISPVHIPLFTVETLRSMDKVNSLVVIPRYDEKEGHPLLLSESVFNKVLQYDGPDGLKGALSYDNAIRKFVDVDDMGVLADTRDRINVSSLTEQQGLQKIRPDAKIQLAGEKGFFGPGALLLLNLTRETGSLKQAARQMGISYGKAIKMIALIEEQIGYKILGSRSGGSGGGGSSVLTKRGLDLMKRYEAFEAECTEFVKNAFDRYFS